MAVLSRSIYVFGLIDALIASFIGALSYISIAKSYTEWGLQIIVFTALVLLMLNIKGFYNVKKY